MIFRTRGVAYVKLLPEKNLEPRAYEDRLVVGEWGQSKKNAVPQ